MPYFRAFSAFSVTATNFMNSITFVMNHLISYFDISICHCSNRTLCYHLFKFHGFNHGYFLGGTCYIHLTMRTNAVFMGFSATLDTVSISFNSFFWMTIFRFFLLWHFQQSSWNRTLTYPHFAFIGYNHGFRLGGACYIHLTMGTNAVFSGFFSLFGHGNQLYELNHFRDESSDFLFRHFYMPLFKSNSLLPPF